MTVKVYNTPEGTIIFDSRRHTLEYVFNGCPATSLSAKLLKPGTYHSNSEGIMSDYQNIENPHLNIPYAILNKGNNIYFEYDGTNMSLAAPVNQKNNSEISKSQNYNHLIIYKESMIEEGGARTLSEFFDNALENIGTELGDALKTLIETVKSSHIYVDNNYDVVSKNIDNNHVSCDTPSTKTTLLCSTVNYIETLDKLIADGKKFNCIITDNKPENDRCNYNTDLLFLIKPTV